MGFDEDLGKLGASMAGKTSYRFVQREQPMVRNNSMFRFIPLLAILVILLPAIALNATPLGRMLWDKSSVTSGNYPYVFQNSTHSGHPGHLPSISPYNSTQMRRLMLHRPAICPMKHQMVKYFGNLSLSLETVIEDCCPRSVPTKLFVQS